MCYFLTATMAPQGNEASVRRLAKALMLHWERLDPSGVHQSLLPGEAYYLTTRGPCDCGTQIGLARRTEGAFSSRERDFSRDIRNLKKKGWSATKIDRWIEQSKADTAKKHQEVASRLAGRHFELERWIEFIASVLQDGHAQWIGILVHWYSGDIATEAIAVDDRRWLSRSELTEEYLLHAEEEVIHCFRS